MKNKKKNNFEVAKIFDTFGYKGSLRVYLLSDFERFENNKQLYTIKDNEKVFLTIKQSKKASNFYIVDFLEIETVEVAKTFKGLYLYTDEMPTLGKNEYHYQQLIGLSVYLENNQKIGKVDNIIFNPTQQVLEISYKNKIIMVPFCDEFIKVEDDKVLLTPIEGML